MRIKFNRYKNDTKRAFTMSYDDGRIYDLRLLEIFNKYGIKGTFNLNAANIGKEGCVTEQDVSTAYAGHEIASHGLTHQYFERVPAEELVYEIMEDRRRLESLCGYPVCGVAYPFGTYSPEVIAALKSFGIKYARTGRTTGDFSLHESPVRDFYVWNPTAEHRDPRMFDLLNAFFNTAKPRPLSLFYIYGHSYSFNDDDNWDLIERICARAAGDPDTWYATNMEICDYLTALRQLRFSADRTIVYNPCALDLWIEADRVGVKVPAGATVRVDLAIAGKTPRP